MLIYLFKDKNNERLITSEREAHNKLRTLSNWERQDLRYLGACPDTISINSTERRNQALKMVISESPETKSIDLQLKVATLEKKNDEIALLTSKKELIEMNIELSINKLGTPDSMPTQKDDLNRSKYLKYIDQLQKEEIDLLIPDPKIFPKDFSRVEHSFGGGEAAGSDK